MDPIAEPDSDDFRLVRAVNDSPVGDPRALGPRSSIRSGFPAPQLPDSSGGGDYEAAETGHAYPAQHPDRSVSAIREIAVPELVTARRRYGLLGGLHRSAENPAFPREQEAREELRHVVPDFMAGARSLTRRSTPPPITPPLRLRRTASGIPMPKTTTGTEPAGRCALPSAFPTDPSRRASAGDRRPGRRFAAGMASMPPTRIAGRGRPLSRVPDLRAASRLPACGPPGEGPPD